MGGVCSKSDSSVVESGNKRVKMNRGKLIGKWDMACGRMDTGETLQLKNDGTAVYTTRYDCGEWDWSRGAPPEPKVENGKWVMDEDNTQIVITFEDEKSETKTLEYTTFVPPKDYLGFPAQKL